MNYLKLLKFVLFIVFLIPTVTLAQTQVSGIISSNTTWTKANSPYHLTNHLTINQGVELIIEPGVIVEAKVRISINVLGSIYAVGTVADSIQFKGNGTKGSWIGLKVRNTGGSTLGSNFDYVSGSKFSYVKISDADNAIYQYNCSLHITNSLFSNNLIGLQHRSSSRTLISDSKFTNNNKGGYVMSINEYLAQRNDNPLDIASNISDLKYDKCEFSNNTIGLVFDYQNAGIFERLTVSNCFLKSNSTGIKTGNEAIAYFRNSIFSNNKFIGNNTGFDFDRFGGDSNNKVSSNLFYDNQNAFNFGGYREVIMEKNIFYRNNSASKISSEITISKSNYLDNNSGITISSGFNSYNFTVVNSFFSDRNKSLTNSFIKFEQLNISKSYTIRSNNFFNVKPPIVKANVSTGAISFDGNYIENPRNYTNNELFSSVDPFNSPITINNPSATPSTDAPFSLVRNVTKSLSSGRVTLTWTANTESDISGYKIYYGGYTGYSFSTVIDAGNVTTYTLPTGVSLNDPIAVTAYDTSKDGVDDQFDGNESWYSLANTRPSTPAALAGDIGPRRVRLTWTAGSSGAADAYYVYRSTDNVNFTRVASTTNLHHVDQNLTGYTSYYYKVSAFDSLDLSYENYGLESERTAALQLKPTRKIYVGTNGATSNIGSEAAPLRAIQAGIDYAITGDSIFVAAGTYKENLRLIGKVLHLEGIAGPTQTILEPLQPTTILYMENAGSSRFNNFTFTKGAAQAAGSAFAERLSSPIFDRCIFRNNGGSGGIIMTYAGSFTISNSLFFDNNPNTLFEFSNSVDAVPLISQSTFVNNENLFSNAGQVSFVPKFVNCIIWSDTRTSVDYIGALDIESSIYKGTYSSNATNTNQDPKFVNSAAKDFRLSNFSPAIGIGGTNNPLPRDLNGAARPNPVGSRPDLGAYENETGIGAPEFTAISSEAGLVNLTWVVTTPTAVDSIYLYKGTSPNPTTLYKKIARTSSFSDTENTTRNDTLYYRLTAKTTGNLVSAYSNELKTIPHSAPTILAPTNNSTKNSKTPSLTWAKVPKSNSYRVQIATTDNFNTLAFNAVVSDTVYLSPELRTNTTYFWRVRVESTNPARNSAWSSTSRFQTLLDQPQLSVIGTAHQKINLAWTIANTTGIKSYRVFKGTAANNLTLAYTLDSTKTSLEDVVQNGITYFYAVSAINQTDIESDRSAVVSALAFAPATLTAPTANQTKVPVLPQFSWTQVASATIYQVQVSKDSTFAQAPELNIQGNFQNHSPSTALNQNQTYFIRLRNGDAKGFSNWTSPVKFQTLITPPQLISVVAGNKKNRLTWTAQNPERLDSVKIYRAKGTESFALLTTLRATSTTYLDSALALNTTFQYKIKGSNAQGVESEFSNTQSGTPFNSLPRSASLEARSFPNAGEFNTVRVVYSANGSTDQDGVIQKYEWFLNGSKVNITDPLFINFYSHGTTDVKLVITDDDGGKDSVSTQVSVSTFKKRLNGGIFGGLTAVNSNRIYAADSYLDPTNGAKVQIIDRKGTNLFDLVVGNRIFTTPSVTSDSSVFITSGSNLNGFNKGGAALWPTLPLGGNSRVTPSIDEISRRIYLGVSNSNFFAIDYLSGRVGWNVICDAPIESSAVITADRKLVFITKVGTMYGFDISTGVAHTAPGWKVNFGEVSLKSVAIDDTNHIIFGTEKGNVYKVKLEPNGTITTLWKVPVSSSINSSPVIDSKGFIYIGDEEGFLSKLNPSTGAILWKFNAKAPIRSTPAISNFESINFATQIGTVFSLDVDGKLRWKYTAGAPISANILYIDNMLYLGTEEGDMIALYDNPTSNTTSPNARVSDQTTTTTPVWATFQGDFRRTGSKKDVLAPVVRTKNINASIGANGIVMVTASQVNDGSTDNVGITQFTLSKTTFTCADLGTNKVTFTARDATGNSSSTEVTITLVDEVSPLLKVKTAYQIKLDAEGKATLRWEDIDEGSSDNCSIKDRIISKTTFTCTDLGTNTVTFTVQDATGNTATAEVSLTVVDEAKPVLKVKSNYTIKLGTEGIATLKWEDIDEGSSDNCSITTRILSKSAFTCENLGNNKVTFTIRDATGNTSSAEVNITVIDDAKPMLKVKSNYTIKLDAEGRAALKWEDLDEGSTDNCSIRERILSKTAFNCTDLGASKLTYTVRDALGNTSTAEINLNVVDEAKPIIRAKAVYLIKLDTEGKASLRWEDIDDGSRDNCSITERKLSKTDFILTDGGVNKVIYTITDASGNTSSIETTVRVDVVLSAPERANEGNGVKAFPNPVNDYLYLDFAQGVNTSAIRESSLVDTSGRVLGEIRLEDGVDGRLGFSTRDLKAGMYFLRLSTRDTLHLIKFTVIH